MRWRSMPEGVKPGHPDYCDHAKWAVVAFRCASGLVQARPQCLVCGETSPESVKNADIGRRPFDATMAARRKEVVDQAWATHFAARDANRNAEIEAQNAAWWASYDAYLRTSQWAAIRVEALRRDNGTCQARLPDCTMVATQCHHVTYKTYVGCGMTALYEVVSLCRHCHDTITAAHRASAATWSPP